MAQYDALTGLPNRLLFLDRLAHAILRADRNKESLGLMFLDLDGFKQINDTHGHRAGDILLKQFAERLAASVRKTDTVARLAGDEFTVVLEALASPARDVQAIAAKIIQAMTQPFDVLGHSLTVTTSIGIVIGSSDKIETDQLIHLADIEMYKAKKMGKNQFSLTSA
jgi:diguanylate cyclase (GGDEF)-like protein